MQSKIMGFVTMPTKVNMQTAAVVVGSVILKWRFTKFLLKYQPCMLSVGPIRLAFDNCLFGLGAVHSAIIRLRKTKEERFSLSANQLSH